MNRELSSLLFGRPRILVVDDDQEICHILNVVLKDEGFTVLEAHGPGDGLNLAKEKNPCLVLLDITLPVMSGFEVLRKLRRRPQTERIPVLMLTAANDMYNVDLAFKLGATDYVTKPIEFDRLLAKINQWATA